MAPGHLAGGPFAGNPRAYRTAGQWFPASGPRHEHQFGLRGSRSRAGRGWPGASAEPGPLLRFPLLFEPTSPLRFDRFDIQRCDFTPVSLVKPDLDLAPKLLQPAFAQRIPVLEEA